MDRKLINGFIWALIFVIIVSCDASRSPRAHHHKAKLNISVFYESRCPDSIKFIRGQLYPLYTKISEYLDLDLVPYGVASTTSKSDGTFSFDCQHGPKECLGNKIHACAISTLLPEVSAAFVNCSMSHTNPEEAGPGCSRKLKIDWTPISKCANSTDGDALLNQNGIRTTSLNPTVYWVPWILYDGVFYDQDLEISQSNLLSVVCRHIKGKKPMICDSDPSFFLPPKQQQRKPLAKVPNPQQYQVQQFPAQQFQVPQFQAQQFQPPLYQPQPQQYQPQQYQAQQYQIPYNNMYAYGRF